MATYREEVTQKFNNLPNLYAPSGYGLGTTAKVLTSADDLNTIRVAGWYAWTASVPANCPYSEYTAGYYAYSLMRVDCYANLDAAVQTIYAVGFSGEAPGTTICRFSNIYDWFPWDYVNPPLRVGIEYRTTERFMGKPVYQKLINAGIPVGGPNVVSLPANIEWAISATGYIKDPSMIAIAPSFFSTISSDNALAFYQINSFVPNGITFYVGASLAASNYTLYTLLKYTKTTD